MDGEAWYATVHGVAKSRTRLSDLAAAVLTQYSSPSDPLQYSCLEKPMDGGAWRATVHGVTKSQTQLGD